MVVVSNDQFRAVFCQSFQMIECFYELIFPNQNGGEEEYCTLILRFKTKNLVILFNSKVVITHS